MAVVFESKVMDLNFCEGVGYLTFKDFKEYSFLNHCYSTRLGGISDGFYRSMNLCFSVGDDLENVLKNYKIFCKALDFDFKNLVTTEQIHEDNIAVISKISHTEKGSGVFKIPNSDGLITNVPGIVLNTFHADCDVLFLIDPIKKVVGLAHAGWRGTVKKICSKLVNIAKVRYGCNEKNIICALGPSILKCCFEVSKDILPYFDKLKIEKTYIHNADVDGKVYIDLHDVNKQLLINAGVSQKNIILADVCTKCNKDILFSHRAMGVYRGGNSAFISIKK